MPITTLDIRSFTQVEMIEPDSSSHTITKGYIEGQEGIWFCKEALDTMRAHIEILGQELYRLLIPENPKMLLAKDLETEQYFILSEEVIDLKFVPKHKEIRLTNGVYTGLGQILVASVFLHEIDLNLGNLGLNRDNKFIKIDGDWSFASFIKPDLLRGKLSNITPGLLDRLPYLTEYDAQNWLDVINLGRNYLTSEIFSDDLIHAPHFRFEINSALLQIILLPDDYIRGFIEFYAPEHAEDLLLFLLERKRQLKHSAVQNISFLEFLSTQAAENVAEAHLEVITNFTAANEQSSVLSMSEQSQHQYRSKWTAFRNRYMHTPKMVTDEIEDDLFDIETIIEPEFASIDRNRLFAVTPGYSDSSRSTSSASSSKSGSSLMRFNRTFSNLSSMS